MTISPDCIYGDNCADFADPCPDYYDFNFQCQCNDECEDYNNCCAKMCVTNRTNSIIGKSNTSLINFLPLLWTLNFF